MPSPSSIKSIPFRNLVSVRNLLLAPSTQGDKTGSGRALLPTTSRVMKLDSSEALVPTALSVKRLASVWKT